MVSTTCTWTLADLCRVLGVSRDGYYQWRAASPPPVPGWQPAAQQAFTRHASRYGTRRLRAELQAEGHQVGRCAASCGLAANVRSAPVLSARAPPRPTRLLSWPRTGC